MKKDFKTDVICSHNKNYDIHPISYRVHTHDLGVVVSGYLVQNNQMIELGRMNPQMPQVKFF